MILIWLILYQLFSSIAKAMPKDVKIKGTVCRFNFPRPPSARTFICRKMEENEQACQCPSQPCDCPKPPDRMRKDAAEQILSAVRKAITDKDANFDSVEQMFASLGIDQEMYEMAYERLGKDSQVTFG